MYEGDSEKPFSGMTPEEFFHAAIRRIEKLEAELNEASGLLKQERSLHEGTLISITHGKVCVNWALAPPEAVQLTIFDGLYHSNRRPYYWMNDKNEMLVNGRWVHQDYIKTSGYAYFGKD